MITALLSLGSFTLSATLTVTASGQSSRAVPVRVVAAQFGAYSRIRNLSPWGARTANSPNQAAAPGEAVVLEGTGLGSATAPQVFIGGKRGTLVSVRRGTTGKAADEIAVRIPAGAPEGCFVPVQVRGAGRLPSNIVTVAIHRGGGSCSPLEAIPFASWAGSRLARPGGYRRRHYRRSRRVLRPPAADERPAALLSSAAARNLRQPGAGGRRYASAAQPRAGSAAQRRG